MLYNSSESSSVLATRSRPHFEVSLVGNLFQSYYIPNSKHDSNEQFLKQNIHILKN